MTAAIDPSASAPAAAKSASVFHDYQTRHLTFRIYFCNWSYNIYT